MELMERIAAYNALLDRKAQLADETTENNKAIEQARRDLADLMIDAEIDRVSSGGYTFTVSEKTAFSKRGGADEQLFACQKEFQPDVPFRTGSLERGCCSTDGFVDIKTPHMHHPLFDIQFV